MTRSHYRRAFDLRDPLRSEHGTILVLAALFLIGIFFILAIVVDGARIASASREKNTSSGSIALAALDGYISVLDASGRPIAFNAPLAPGEQMQRFNAGIRRAFQVGTSNSLTSRFDEKQIDTIFTAAGDPVDASDLYAPGNVDGPGRKGHVEFGRWHSQRPAVCNIAGCPCTLPANAVGRGCFQPCPNSQGCPPTDGTSSRFPANAVRATLWTEAAAGKGVDNLLGAIGNSPEFSVQSQSIAAIVPRRFAILFDLSRIQTVQTHLHHEKVTRAFGATPPPTQPPPAEFAFLCAGNGCTFRDSATNTPASCAGGFAPWYIDPGERAWWANLFNSRTPQQIWNALPLVALTPGPTSHGKMDYQCVSFEMAPARGSGSTQKVQRWALIDTRTIAEPYNTQLEAMRSVLDGIAASAQKGDRVGLVGFHREAPAMDIEDSSLMNSGRMWKFASAEPNDQWFQTMRLMTFNSSAGWQKRVDNGFFPLHSDPYSDLSNGLDAARDMLLGDGFSSLASNHVVLITSGLSSCAPQGTGRACSSDYSRHIASLQDALSTRVTGGGVNSFVNRRIQLHTISVGDNTPANFIPVKSTRTPSQCMTERELIESACIPSIPLINSSGTIDHIAGAQRYERIGSDVTPQEYFNAPYYLRIGSWTTGGKFVPLFSGTGCPTSGQDCDPTNPNSIMGRLNAACGAAPAYPASLQQACRPTASGADQSWLYAIMTSSPPLPSQRPDGRITCDPLCRPTGGQINAGLGPLLEPTSILLVEES